MAGRALLASSSSIDDILSWVSPVAPPEVAAALGIVKDQAAKDLGTSGLVGLAQMGPHAPMVVAIHNGGQQQQRPWHGREEFASMQHWQLLFVVLGVWLSQTCTCLKRVQGSLQGKSRVAQAAHGRLVST